MYLMEVALAIRAIGRDRPQSVGKAGYSNEPDSGDKKMGLQELRSVSCPAL